MTLYDRDQQFVDSGGVLVLWQREIAFEVWVWTHSSGCCSIFAYPMGRFVCLCNQVRQLQDSILAGFVKLDVFS